MLTPKALSLLVIRTNDSILQRWPKRLRPIFSPLATRLDFGKADTVNINPSLDRQMYCHGNVI